MDHLPYIQHPHDALKIPDLGGEEYDSRGFFDFPDRYGWSDERLSQSLLQVEAKLKAEQFLQTWLFYGLLSEIMGVSVPRGHFSRADTDGQRWVTTKRLPEYVGAWYNRTRWSTKEENTGKHKHCNKCLHSVVQLFRGKTGYSLKDILRTEIELSILILLGTLDWCVVKIYGASVDTIEPSGIERIGARPMTLLKPVLLENGWCPSLINRLIRMVGISGLYYATLLGPTSVKKAHSFCSNGECAANDVDDERYTIKHVHKGCRCDFSGPAVDTLKSIVEAGRIPIISIHEHGCVVEVTALNSGMNYVAISHVWSDGIGNPKANSLPRCQLQFLQEIVEENGSKNLWIDTLCVPVWPQTARKAAIRKMSEIYSHATRVLTLDAELMNSTANCNAEEIFMRVITSTWFHRLWTLQEAALAKSRLFIQFRERAIDINALSDATCDTFGLHNEIAFRTHSILIQPWLIFSDLSLSAAKRFCVVWQAIQGRSTSKVADEPICVATLLGTDVNKLIDTPDENRMVEFWSQQTELPLSLLFLNGPKLKVDGYQWAPSTLLKRGKKARLVAWDRGVAYNTSCGISVVAEGIRLSGCTDALKGHVFRFSDRSLQMTYIMYLEREEDDNHPRPDVNIGDLEAPAIVLREAVTQRRIAAGILVADCREDGDTVSARYIGNVRIFREGGDIDKFWGVGKNVPIERTRVAIAENTSKEQKWCIR